MENAPEEAVTLLEVGVHATVSAPQQLPEHELYAWCTVTKQSARGSITATPIISPLISLMVHLSKNQAYPGL